MSDGGNVKSLVTKFSRHYQRDVNRLGFDPDRIPTGIFALDLSMGGGIPENRMSIFFGPEGSTKSMLAQLVVAQAQRKYPDLTPVYFDVEHTLTTDRAKILGVDLDRWVPITPDSAEEVIDMSEEFLYAPDISVVVVDSLAAMIAERELKQEASTDNVGGTTMAIGKLYRKSARALGQARRDGRKATVLWINQVRSRIGGYGNPETMPGGHAIRFGSSMSVRMYGKDVRDGDVSKELPAFKKVSTVIKKTKVPIVNTNSEFHIALLDNDKANLRIGQTDDTSVIMSYLKSYDLLESKAKGYALTWADTGEVQEFRVQKDIKQALVRDADFAARVRKMLVEIVMGEKVVDSDE